MLLFKIIETQVLKQNAKMNIVKENIDELNAILKVKVVEDDYLPKVESALKEYQRKDKTKGFRPGKIPAGLIKKMYGKLLVKDEVIKVVMNSMDNFLNENKDDLLGNPIPKNKEALEKDWQNEKEFEFLFDVGLTPKFKVAISPQMKFDYPIVKINEELLTTFINEEAKRYGKVMQAEVTQVGDLVYGDFEELDANGDIVVMGIFKSGSVFLDKVKHEQTRKSLIGLKKEDKVIVNSQNLAENKEDLAKMIEIDVAFAQTLNSDFQFTVRGITRMLPAQLNQDFFDKIFGSGVVSTEKEFRAKYKAEVEKSFVGESEASLYHAVYQHLMDVVKINLPDEFLKRVMHLDNEKRLTAEELESEYEKFAKNIKWQLIEKKIVDDFDISVTKEEMIDFTQQLIYNQHIQYSSIPITEEEMEKRLKMIFGNEKEIKKISDRLFTEKLTELFKTKFTLENKEVDYNDFYNVKK